MTIKHLYVYRLLFNFLFLTLFGILIMFFPYRMINSCLLIVSFLAISKLFVNMFLWLGVKKYGHFLFDLLLICIIVIFSFFNFSGNNIFAIVINYVIGFYFLLDSINRFICLLLTYKEDIKRAIYYTIGFLVCLVFCIFIFMRQFSYLTAIFIGFYCIGLGFSYIRDFINSLGGKRISGVRPSIPAFIALFLPYIAYLKHMKRKKYGLPVNSYLKKSDKEPDMYVSIHVGPKLYSKPGHIDVCIDDETFSYGQYDKDSLFFFKVFGDGVMYAVHNREKYQEFVKDTDHKIIFEYGFSLTDEEKKNVRNRVKELKADAIPWSSKYDYTYAHKLESNIGAKFYKFKSGELKKYFSARNNCVFLVDTIIKFVNVDSFDMGSFIIPGSYFYYLEEQLKIKNSNVISRKIYM